MSSTSGKKQKQISVRSARMNNLKNISVDIPHFKFTVVTGVSGSGKSTLAFDTIYAEGQRRFVESLSAYARQFLERMNKPNVDSITGLPPAIAIEQRPASKNPRSTVGTSTEIYDYFRLLFGRIGTMICRQCGKQVFKDNPNSVVNNILGCDENDKIYILFPLKQQARNLDEDLKLCKESGFFRIIIGDSDEIINLEEEKIENELSIENINILVDRLALQKDKESVTRLTDSIETAFTAGGGKIIIKNISKNETYKFSSLFECADCEIIYYEPEPRLFSFNNPYGACPHCQGFGRTIGIDDELVVPDKSKSIRQGAIHPYRSQGQTQYLRDLINIAPKFDISVDAPLQSLTSEQMKIIWDGTDDYIGLNGFFSMVEEQSYKMQYRVLMSRYRGYTRCKQCGGSRIRTSARQVYVSGKNIPELIKLPLGELLEYINKLELTEHQEKIAGQIVREIKWRLGLLIDIGLDYLTLSRLTHTLSGGEAQRINLATALGSSLVGTLYVLDEPSIGMHSRDTKRLLNILFKLRNLGNTIIVVEHDPDIIRAADMLIDLGPRAGEYGGELIYSGSAADIVNCDNSLTGQYLSGKKKIEIPKKRHQQDNKKIVLHKPRKHNLKIDKVAFPLECITAVTGVSGSGKSTLIHDVLYAGLRKVQGGYDGKAGSYQRIEGSTLIESIEMVDQTPIGKSTRSTPATFTKAFDFIRELYSETQAARQLGYKPGYFSFNVSGGRCEVCEGEGTITMDMQFLPDVHLVCEACKGTRYKKETRSILYKGKSIVDVLNMTIDEAAEFFKDERRIQRKLSILQDVGLGYLRLGQPSTMLSGGESQRLKLASHLETKKSSGTLFIFDEPTTGLHLDDISKLIECFHRLIDMGNTIIVIEHNLHVIASADWVIDLGPEAGKSGGEIVAIGTPEQIAADEKSYTGRALREFFRK